MTLITAKIRSFQPPLSLCLVTQANKTLQQNISLKNRRNENLTKTVIIPNKYRGKQKNTLSDKYSADKVFGTKSNTR